MLTKGGNDYYMTTVTTKTAHSHDECLTPWLAGDLS